jgi:uncharacterized protein (TIGR03000 family)
LVQVEIPDPDGILYAEGELLRSGGTVRQLQSPPLPRGREFPLRLRAAFRMGANLLIEEKLVQLRAGEQVVAAFDGRAALSVPFPLNRADFSGE